MELVGFAQQPWGRVHLAADRWRIILCVEGSELAPPPEEAAEEISAYRAARRTTVSKRPYMLIVSGSAEWIRRYLEVPADVLSACSDAATLNRLEIPIIDQAWDGVGSLESLIARGKTDDASPPRREKQGSNIASIAAAVAAGYVAGRREKKKAKKLCGNCLKETDALWLARIEGFPGQDWKVCWDCVAKWRSQEKLIGEPEPLQD